MMNHMNYEYFLKNLEATLGYFALNPITDKHVSLIMDMLKRKGVKPLFSDKVQIAEIKIKSACNTCQSLLSQIPDTFDFCDSCSKIWFGGSVPDVVPMEPMRCSYSEVGDRCKNVVDNFACLHKNWQIAVCEEHKEALRNLILELNPKFKAVMCKS